MSSHPPSPGAAPPEADDDEMPPQVDEESEVEDAAVSRPYLLFYQKKYYEVPAEAVVYDLRRSLVVPSGEDAAQLHESK